MIDLPAEYELIGFFECEPELLDADVEPWVYNVIKFTVKKGEDEVLVKICASYGELGISWLKAGAQVITLNLVDLDKISVEMQHGDEFMVALGQYNDHAVMLKLRLKPIVAIELEQQFIL